MPSALCARAVVDAVATNAKGNVAQRRREERDMDEIPFFGRPATFQGEHLEARYYCFWAKLLQMHFSRPDFPGTQNQLWDGTRD